VTKHHAIPFDWDENKMRYSNPKGWTDALDACAIPSKDEKRCAMYRVIKRGTKYVGIYWHTTTQGSYIAGSMRLYRVRLVPQPVFQIEEFNT
jgi:hypothetical protein